jgi:hypothetical protein
MSRPVPFKALQLTPRDIEIILMIYHYDGLVISQIRRRFWPSFGARSPMYERLGRLGAADYIRSIRLPAVTRSGSGPTFYTLGAASYPLLKELLGLSRSDIKRLRHHMPLYWMHDAQVRDFRLTLQLACEGSELVELSEWITDSQLKRDSIKVVLDEATTHELVPDGIFTLSLADGRSKTAYLEIDRGTHQSPIAFRRKIRAYLSHIGARPTPVLYVVPDEARREKLSSWIAAEALSCEANAKLFAIALRGHVSQETILHGPIWQVVGGPTMAILPDSQERAPQLSFAPSSDGWLDAVFGKGAIKL